jgi:hypothetical protein
VGRASNRKKAQRQSGLSSRQARQQSRADAARYEAMQVIAAGTQALAQQTKGRQAAACRISCGGAEAVPAKALRWATDSLGDRLFSSTFLDRVRSAPCLATAQIPVLRGQSRLRQGTGHPHQQRAHRGRDERHPGRRLRQSRGLLTAGSVRIRRQLHGHRDR